VYPHGFLHFNEHNTKYTFKRKMVLVGSFTGATAQFLASPTDLVKVIMQANGKQRIEGKTHRQV
jgi:hypothetical protein